MLKVLDLFAGAGGLSLGFEQTRKFKVVVAFENNHNARKTYSRNHPHVKMHENVCDEDYTKLKGTFGEIDVVIGGPPCQGFSNANRQKNYAISQNNMLVKEYIRAVIDLQPKAFVMENVGMLKSKTHIFYVTKDEEKLVKEYSLKIHKTHIVLLEDKYLFSGVMSVATNVERIRSNMWDSNAYQLVTNIIRHKRNLKKLNHTIEKHKNKLEKVLILIMQKKELREDHIFKADEECCKAISEYIKNGKSVPQMLSAIETALMYQRMLGKAKELIDHNILVNGYEINTHLIAHVDSVSVYDYLVSILGSDINGYSIDSDVLNAADFGVPQKRNRFVVMGVKKDISESIELPKPILAESEYAKVRDAIEDLSQVEPIYSVDEDTGIPIAQELLGISDYAKKMRDSNMLHNHIITENRETALERFAAIKPGQNFHSLEASMKENTYTDASRTQNTIYLRVDYDKPSGTVVNVRKSMWIHPEHNRAISVREAARVQSFPDSYVFEGTKDSQYQQVGNAVPPMLAKAIAESISSTLIGKCIQNDV